MLNVNTIEFNGRKVVINSYTDHPALIAGRKSQIENWRKRFPNATVQTELMTEEDTIALVTAGHEWGGDNCAWRVGESSVGN